MKTCLLLVFVLGLAALVAPRFSALLEGSDFPDFYCAARMVAEGHGRQLYDAPLQRQYQQRYAGRVGTLYIHPPFEAAIYLTLAWLPLKSAYLLWFLINLGFLAAAVRILVDEVHASWDWRISLVASLTFVPALLCLQQGQDSLLLLLLITLLFRSLRRQRAFTAGCWLALGLFKFQIVLPMALVLFLAHARKAGIRLGQGFIAVALALSGFSALISGWSVFSVYPRFLAHLPEQPFAGINPEAMANFRGLIYVLFRGESKWSTAVVLALSLCALLRAITVWRRASYLPNQTAGIAVRDLAFANTVIFALLASYHLNPHDLSLLLLPVALLAMRLLGKAAGWSASDWGLALVLAGLFLPPLHLWALRAGVYFVLGLPVIVLLLWFPYTSRNEIPNTTIGNAKFE